MRYYLIAGEASGDLHGSNLLKGLKAEDPDAVFRFRGGGLMAEAAGTPPVVHYREGAVMGLAEVLAKAGQLSRSLRDCKNDIAAWKPDVVILIDYPGFNMRVAKFCHEAGIRVFWYIAPKTWASRAGRNRKLKAYVDKLFVVFPFEVPYFKETGIPFIYKGNPLLDAIDAHVWQKPCEEQYIALLPGSRKSEISHMLPVCIKALEKTDMKVLIAGAPSRTPSDYEPYIRGKRNVQLMFGRTYDILKYARCAIVNSGTASLEAAVIGTPQVVCWNSSRLTYLAMKYIGQVEKHIKYISLGNLCLDKLAFKELIQDEFTPEALYDELRLLCTDEKYRAAMKDDYALIRHSLGEGGASAAIAKSMIEDIQNPTI